MPIPAGFTCKAVPKNTAINIRFLHSKWLVVLWLLVFSIIFLVRPAQKSQAFESVYSDVPTYQVWPGKSAASTSLPKLLIIASIGPQEDPHFQAAWVRLEVLRDILKSHWDVHVDLVDYAELNSSDIESSDVIMMVEEYEIEFPLELYQQLSTFDGHLIWSGYNIDTLLDRLAVPYQPITQTVIPQTITYEGVDFSGDHIKPLGSQLQVNPSDRVTHNAIATGNGQTYPVIYHIDDKWSIMPFEIPYTYGVDDYSIIFLDQFHHLIGRHHPQKLVLLRLEDVDTYTYRNTRGLSRVYDYLKANNIPFHIAFITRYINPGKDIDFTFGDTGRFQNLIAKMQGEGLGTIIQHGYTHQYKDSISGSGFEFWDEISDAPVQEDSPEFVQQKIAAVQSIMQEQGFPVPDIWETPHYGLSELDDQIINQHYPLRYGDLQNWGSLPFAATIQGTTYIPENLGYILDANLDLDEIAYRLDRLNTFEDPTASAFWHPWRDRQELEHLVEMMDEQGYVFVSAYDLLDSKNQPGFVALSTFRSEYSYKWRQTVTDVWIALCFTMFSIGLILYIVNRIRIHRYKKHLKTTKIDQDQLQDFYNQNRKSIPRIAILVPARNESDVIANTIGRLAKINYPKTHYRIVIIVDERELDDEVDITTKSVVTKMMRSLNRKFGPGFVQYLQAPKWYSGKFNSRQRTYAKSTKGRALNYALQRIKNQKFLKDTDVIGVVDADGRLDVEVLKEVAYKRLKYNALVLQGPVFQVSNFGQVSLTGTAAGLELAIYHLTDLPHRLINRKRNPQFLAGTNYFIDRNILYELGGLNHKALVEDAELSLRLYVQKGIVAEWLSWPEVEQTPQNFSVYKKQRERWSMGHMSLIPHILSAPIGRWEKYKFVSLIIFNQIRVLIDLGIPILGWMLMLSGVLLDVGVGFRELSIILLIGSFFIWDFYGMMYRSLTKMNYIPAHQQKSGFRLWVESFKLMLFMPFFIVIQSIPRITATIKIIFNTNQTTWYKTARTKEAFVEQA